MPAVLADDTERFLEDVLIRWSGIAERAWRAWAGAGRNAARRPGRAPDRRRRAARERGQVHGAGDGVELQARTEDGEDRTTFVIEVSDSGPGVPLDAAESIFERSSRAREGERPGLGIGLAIVDAIATAHGGSCTLEPSSGGSRFALRIPGFTPAAVEAEAPVV